MSPVSIKAAEYPIYKILCDDYVFDIPQYQRPYSWTTENAQALLDDILTNVENTTIHVDELPPYFLGSIVVIKGESPKAEVVDGQQRLTTLSILLSALREFVPKDIADGITWFLYEKPSPLLGTTGKYRVTLRPKDADFFKEYIQEQGGPLKLASIVKTVLSDSQRNIRDNCLYYMNRFSAMSDSDMINLATYISKRCYLVVVSTADFDSAYRIFSVLNDRGLDLSHSDILKADIIGLIPDDKQTSYGEKWENIEEQLGRENFNDLFAHIRMIYRKQKMRTNVLKEVRDYVIPTSRPTIFIDEILTPLGKALDSIKNATYQSTTNAEQINELFKWLFRIDNTDWVPPALLFLSRNYSQPQNLVGFFKDLDRLAMGLSFLRAGINQRIERYGRLLSEIETGKDLSDPNSSMQLTDIEKQQIRSVLNGNVYDSIKLRMPLLLRLDSLLSSGGATYDYSVLTVEHVLPQNPAANSEWLTVFPDENERNELVNCIGNLVLLSRRKNSQAQNFDFARKKTEYFTRNGVSPFALTTQVVQYSTWTPDIIRQRRDTLVKMLQNHWEL